MHCGDAERNAPVSSSSSSGPQTCDVWASDERMKFEESLALFAAPGVPPQVPKLLAPKPGCHWVIAEGLFPADKARIISKSLIGRNSWSGSGKRLEYPSFQIRSSSA